VKVVSSNDLHGKLLETFFYDENTGVFTRKKTSGGHFKGTVAGCLDNCGYIQIRFNKKKCLAHRLAWLYKYGDYPEAEIDHINHVRSDNRVCNLRVVSSLVNGQNKSFYASNSSGVCGVNWYKNYNKWNAQIQVDGKKINLGYFVEFSEALNARKNAEVLYGFHENHGDLTNEFN